MELSEFLINHKKNIIEEAVKHLRSAHTKSYDGSSENQNYERLEKLFDLTIESIKTKNLKPMKNYSESLGRQRFESGFELAEVTVAFNSLEEQLWIKLLKGYNNSELGKSLGLVSTILGTGKESLAITYVSLASKRKVATLDLSALFQ